jgi:uncharacterized membrane protein YagU involved in acid resistance
MKKFFFSFVIAFCSIAFSQSNLKVTITKRSMFGFFGQDSLHIMLNNSLMTHYTEAYEPIDLVLEIKFKQKKLYYISNGKYADTAVIKNYFVKDSIYDITLTEKHAHFEGKYIDTKLIIDTRINPINKRVPKVCYYWYWEHWNESRGRVTDYALIEKIK